MGIPGILKEIGKGERIALSKLAVEHLEKTGRPFRVAIDVAIWQFQNQAGQGGANPALRTLYYRLLKLLALPIHPLFVYDGKQKPLTKRNKTVTAYGTCLPNEMSKKLIQAFRFPYHTAPGEAEAECALLQKKGIVDAVMSQDVDTLMFGATMTLRDWSKEGTRCNKTASHVNVLRAQETWTKTGLDSEGMILVALLSGGDYNTEGVPGFGPSLACEIAKAKFGTELFRLLRHRDTTGVKEWRDRLQYELETNESGYFRKRHKTLKIPDNFPDPTILGYYFGPAVSSPEQLQKISSKCTETWDTEIDIPALRVYVGEKFEWLYKAGATKLVRTLAPSLLANRLRRGSENTTITSSDAIKERRIHFTNDGLPELRLEIIPKDIVGLNIEDEEGNPAYDERAAGDHEDPVLELDEVNDLNVREAEDLSGPTSPSKGRKSPPWDPAAPQRIWIPETIVKLGITAFVEAWEQKQRDMLADPKSFATRKCPKSKPRIRTRDAGSKPTTMDGFFTSSKPRVTHDRSIAEMSKLQARTELADRAPLRTTIAPRTPSKKASKASKAKADDSSPTIDRYFNVSPPRPLAGLDPGLYCSEVQSSGRVRQYSACRSMPGHDYSHPASAETTETVERLSHNVRTTARPGTQSGVESTGTSFSESIIISSSPPPPSEPATPTTPDSTFVQLPQSVTQRPKRRSKRRFQEPSLSVASKPSAHFKGPRPICATQQLATAATRTLTGHFPTTKPIVLSRHSLQGTWREVDDETLLVLQGETHQRRLPRVSCVDLTAD